MKNVRLFARNFVVVLLLLGTAAAWAADQAQQTSPQVAEVKADGTKAQAENASETKGPPLPVHTIEGYGGGAITPTAYLVNPGSKDEVFGKPSISATGLYIGHGKNLETSTLTETLFGRLELGYGASRFGIGDVKDDIENATGVDVKRNDVWLHNFNLRGLIIEENAGKNSWVPAVTVGLEYKRNEGITDLNDRLGGAFTDIGFKSADGVDATLTASKTFPKLAFGRPVIVSAGVRNSNAAWLGYLGFGDERYFTFEGNVIWMPLDWLAVGYEYRQKTNPYSEISGLVENEDDLHAASLIFIPNKRLSIALVYGALGNVLNAQENKSTAVQVKWEF